MYISQDPIGLQGGDRFYGYVDDPNSFIDLFGLTQKTYKVEASLSNNPRKTHGHQWNEADAKKRANDTGNLQGKFGSKEDANYAVQQAQNLQIGERKVIPAQAGNGNVLIDKNGNKQPASHIFIEVKPSGNTGTIHAFPVDENYKVTPRPGFTI